MLCSRPSSTSSASPSCATRSCSPCSCSPIYRIGYHVPLPGVDQRRFADAGRTQQQDERHRRRAPRAATSRSSPAATSPRARSSAWASCRTSPRRSSSSSSATVVPSLEKLQKEGETGPQEDPGVDALRDRAAVHHPGDLLADVHAQLRPAAGPAATSGTRRCFWLMGICRPHRRLHLPDVARRADRRVRPGQRHLADHPRRHRRPHAQRDRRC